MHGGLDGIMTRKGLLQLDYNSVEGGIEDSDGVEQVGPR